METHRLKGEQKAGLSWLTLTKFYPTPGPDKYTGCPQKYQGKENGL